MNKLQKLRIQLNFLRAYIFTCSEGTVAELRKLLYGKEYIYETIHIYSVSDLYLIQNNSLEEMLKRVVAVLREHVNACSLCKERGFHCEYCRKSKIIYPFDAEVFVCNHCGSVSHLKCFSMPCPKCERKRRRQLNAALEAENENN
jgi:pleckstrin homology domain-containing family M member 1